MSTKKLDGIRAKIAALVDQRAEIADAPLERGEAEAHIDTVLRAVESHPILGPSPAGLPDGSFDTADLEKLLGRPGFLVALFHDQIKTYLLGIFAAEAGDVTGLPMAKRRQRLTALDGEIFGLERQEEEMIEALEADGADIQRRPDANPRAALGIGASEAA